MISTRIKRNFVEGSNKESNRRQDGQPEARDRFYFKHNCCLYWIVQQALCHFASFYVFSFKHNYCLYLVVQQALCFYLCVCFQRQLLPVLGCSKSTLLLFMCFLSNTMSACTGLFNKHFATLPLLCVFF